MINTPKHSGPANTNTVFGVILLAFGGLLVISQLLGVRLESLFWPLYVIVPGVILLIVGIALAGAVGDVFSSIGGAVAVTGLLLAYQNLTGHWASWAYAWALIAPTGIGLALAWRGRVRDQPETYRTGVQMTTVGLGLFAVGLVFFELVIGVSGLRLGGLFWAFALIALGVLMLVVPSRQAR